MAIAGLDVEASVESDAVDAPRRNWKERSLTIAGLRVVVIAATLGLWQALSGPVVPRFAVSRPTDIARSLGQLLSSRAGWADIRTTAFEILVGFGVGVGIGAVAGILLGTFRLAGRVLEPLVSAFNSIPKVALAPMFLLFFGIGDWSKVAIAATGVAFIMCYSLYYGMQTVRVELEEIVKVMGASRWRLLQYVTLPSLISPFMTGLKTSGPFAIIGVIIGEFLASFNGIGHQLYVDSSDLNAAGVFAGIIVLVLIAFALNLVLDTLHKLVERRLGLRAR